MTYQQFQKYMSALEAMREKITDLKNEHPLYQYYNLVLDKIAALSSHTYESYSSRWNGNRSPA